MGIISLMLTVANVIMVAIGSALMFRAKEVLPVKKKVFWSDLKVQSLMCNLESRLFLLMHLLPHFFSSCTDCKADLPGANY
jgi:hypothetical protein